MSWLNRTPYQATQLLIRGLINISKEYQTMPDNAEKDLCSFAYWTCLQLER